MLDTSKIFGIEKKDLTLIGKGVEGRVFLTPCGNVLKAFTNSKQCKYEYKILKIMEGKRYFPKAIDRKGRFMIREYVKGTPIKDYIEKKGLSRELIVNLIEFADDFEKSNLRVDGISKHVFIQDDESIKVVDPRRKKYYIYRPILRTIKEVQKLDYFLDILDEERPDLATKWKDYIQGLLK